MLFILFDIEVVFLYPVGVILKGADSVFVLGELITFVVLLLVAFVYVWRKGALIGGRAPDAGCGAAAARPRTCCAATSRARTSSATSRSGS